MNGQFLMCAPWKCAIETIINRTARRMEIMNNIKCSGCLYASSTCRIYNNEVCKNYSKFTPNDYGKEPLIGECIPKCDDPKFLMVVHYEEYGGPAVTLTPAANIGEVNKLISKLYGTRRIEVLDRSGAFVMEQLKGSTVLRKVIK